MQKCTSPPLTSLSTGMDTVSLQMGLISLSFSERGNLWGTRLIFCSQEGTTLRGRTLGDRQLTECPLCPQDSNLSLYENMLDLTPCFQNSLLAWTPCIYLWTLLPCYLFYVRYHRRGYIILSHLSRFKTVRISRGPWGGGWAPEPSHQRDGFPEAYPTCHSGFMGTGQLACSPVGSSTLEEGQG